MHSPRRELGFAAEDTCDAEDDALFDCEHSIPGCNKCYDDADKLAGEEGCDCDGAAAAAEKKCAALVEAYFKCDKANPLPDDDTDGDNSDEGEDGDDNDGDADVDCDSVCGPEQIFAVNA